MTVGGAQQKAVRSERRIIERPRLIKLLDETEARTILLLAPAGYGKTTLARQWAKTLNGAIWLTLTPAHCDLAVLAIELSAAVANDADGHAFVSRYVRAHENPQRASREIAGALADQLDRGRTQWVVLDDYHELARDPEAESFVEALLDRTSAQFLIASRIRPRWASARRAVYGDVMEVPRDELAMTDEETRIVLRGRRDVTAIAAQADGWPAVIGLAASTSAATLPNHRVPSALLHLYFTEEVFRAASADVQQSLLRLALAPDLDEAALTELFGDSWRAVIDDSCELGFVSTTNGSHELHPLFRDFLLDKLTAQPDIDHLVENSIEACARRGRWDRALEVILRFGRDDLIEPVLERAYMPLIRSGQLATLASVATSTRSSTRFPPPVVDLAEAEIALRDGAYDLAERLAERARERLPDGHTLLSRASGIVGQSAFVRARLAEAEAAYRSAFESSRTDEDRTEALRGWALASVQGETSDAVWVVAELTKRRNQSPLDLVRCAVVELALMHFRTGFKAADAVIREAQHALPGVEDPRARSSFQFVSAFVQATRGNYQSAVEVQAQADQEIESYGLDFAMPHLHWNHGFIDLGLRKFASAGRHLQRLEDAISSHPLGYHVLNARILRGRLSLQTGRPLEAVETLPEAVRESAIPSIHGEYLATRALALSVLEDYEGACRAVEAANSVTAAVEVRVLTQAVLVITSKTAQEAHLQAMRLWTMAQELDVWDPVTGAARSSRKLADALAGVQGIRSELGRRYAASGDLALARRAGLRARPSGTPHELLSPRELEVLSLLARGYRNKDIAEALVVSNSTVKVHIRHILEKLGVRTRAEAVARLGTAG